MKPSNTSTPRTGIFRKSSYSQSEAACVEVADLEKGAAMRDTKNRELGALFFDAGEWQVFLGTAKGV